MTTAYVRWGCDENSFETTLMTPAEAKTRAAALRKDPAVSDLEVIAVGDDGDETELWF